jgi:hypothetical protein
MLFFDYTSPMRKTSALITYIAALMLSPQFALAAPGAIIVMSRPAVIAPTSDTSACYNVGDSDARSYCLAKARKEASQCYNIQAAGLRSMCLAEVRK